MANSGLDLTAKHADLMRWGFLKPTNSEDAIITVKRNLRLAQQGFSTPNEEGTKL
jgi:hypothetical protein